MRSRCTAGNCIQSLAMEPDGRSSEKKKVYFFFGSLCCTAEIDRTRYINYYKKTENTSSLAWPPRPPASPGGAGAAARPPPPRGRGPGCEQRGEKGRGCPSGGHRHATGGRALTFPVQAAETERPGGRRTAGFVPAVGGCSVGPARQQIPRLLRTRFRAPRRRVLAGPPLEGVAGALWGPFVRAPIPPWGPHPQGLTPPPRGSGSSCECAGDTVGSRRGPRCVHVRSGSPGKHVRAGRAGWTRSEGRRFQET